MYPLVLYPHPIYLKFGGSKLFGLPYRETPKHGEKLAEVWSVSDLNSHSSVVANGPLTGKPLNELLKSHQSEILGRTKMIQGRFPLMIRLLDINEALPPAVHPDHAYAEFIGMADPGKYETAYVLESEPDATLYVGMRKDLKTTDLLDYVKQGKSYDTMNQVTVHPGEAYYVPPGHLHAWGPGALLYEIHTVSNAMFALDWLDFPNKDAQRREYDQTHLLKTIRPELGTFGRTTPCTLKEPGHTRTILFASSHYILEKIETRKDYDVKPRNGNFALYTVTRGTGKLVSKTAGEHELPLYSTVLVPASCDEARIVAAPGTELELLKSYIGDLDADIIKPVKQAGLAAAPVFD